MKINEIEVHKTFTCTNGTNWLVYQLENGEFFLDTEPGSDTANCSKLGWSEAMGLIL